MVEFSISDEESSGTYSEAINEDNKNIEIASSLVAFE